MRVRTAHIVLCSLLAFVAAAHSQSTVFTYHGRLTDNGAVANGNHDMQFVIFASQDGGDVVAGPLLHGDVPVNNGLFAVRLDFGAGVFTGAERWLEVRVRRSGNAEFETLAPRHELTSSPYAIRALNAASAEDVAAGSVVKSLNNLRDHVSLVAGANVTLTPSGNTLTIASTGAGGGGVWSVNNNNAFYTAGNVGIGTSNPQGLLDVASGMSDTSALFVRADPSTFGRGGIIYHQSSVYGWQQLAQQTASPINGLLTFHYVERAAPSTKVASTVLALRANGTVGIGTDSPTARLDVAGDVKGTRLILRADPLAPANATVLCDDPNTANFVPYNTALNRPMNVIARDVTVRQLTITGGADLAEPFRMSARDIPKGSVVVIDEENPGQLRLSTEAYDTRVAGVVSGANGIEPGISLRQEGAIEGGENVALSGRVYVRADAGFGAIKPGDLLTSSSTPGHAMKASAHDSAQGAILGKAMTPLREGRGMVLVLVTLQ